MITGSALTPLLESVAALPAPAYRQEGGLSSRLARERLQPQQLFLVTGSFSNGHVRTGEDRHEKQREDKPFESSTEKEEYKKEPEKIERGKKVPNVIPNGESG